jgi:hypothetical protein
MRFEEYRFELIAAALVFLGISGFFTYRKKPTPECATGSACASPRTGRLNQVIFWVTAALVVLMILYPTIEAHLGG